MTNTDYEQIKREDRLEEFRETQDKRHACQCGGDMPGRCPGPANCPMVSVEDEDEL